MSATQPADFLLFYDYVKDMVERRDPYRSEHRARITAQLDAGSILAAGAYGNPVHGGLFAFQNVTRAHVEEFVAGDPYVAAGLVEAHRIEPWAIVPGSAG
jgi:uncharacterized protein